MSETKQSWVNIKSAEVEKLVLEIAKENESPSKIGIILRDKHGIPKAKSLGKKISKILKENSIKIKSEKEITEGKIEKLKKHSEKNKHDYTAARALTKNLWVLHKTKK